jgi:uncharacterized protein (DUF2267 family)
MKDEEFLSAVKAASGIDDTEHCKDAAKATLSVLGQRLAGGQTHNLTAQLPADYADLLGISPVRH